MQISTAPTRFGHLWLEFKLFSIFVSLAAILKWRWQPNFHLESVLHYFKYCIIWKANIVWVPNSLSRFIQLRLEVQGYICTVFLAPTFYGGHFLIRVATVIVVRSCPFLQSLKSIWYSTSIQVFSFFLLFRTIL